MPRYEMAAKFWEIALTGKSHVIKFGKIGATGQTQLKDFSSTAAAKEAHDKLVAEKTKKGYALVGGKAAPASASAHAVNKKLEADVEVDPDDDSTYLVYADWLQSQGDPRGELIALQHGKKTAAAKKLLEKHRAHFFGTLADAQDLLEGGDHRRAPLTTWRWGYLESIWIGNSIERSSRHDSDKPEQDVAAALDALLGHPSARFVRQLAVGIVTFDQNAYASIARVIAKHRLPTLKKLYLGDFSSHETELNWSDLGTISALYKSVPNLESLTVRSGTIGLGKTIELPKLKELVVITGGLDKPALKAICASKWPHLERLSVQLGRETKFAVKDLAPIFDGGGFPKVTHLGLGNSNIADAICGELARAKIAMRLVSLDLSKGTMGDAGATALAAGTFPKLQSLDVSDSWLSKAGIATLKKVAKTVLSGSQEDDSGDPEDRYISGFE